MNHFMEIPIKDLSGKCVEKMNAKLRSIGVTIMSSMPQEMEHPLFVCQQGQIHNRLKTSLSEIDRRALEFSPMTLQKVYFCQSSLASDPDSLLGNLRSFFVHKFLVVETEVVFHGHTFKKCYRAEKVGSMSLPLDTGIVIQCANECNRDGVRDCDNFTIDCGGKPITLKELENVLEDYEKNYSLKNSCSWDYARDMSKKLLKFCIDCPQTTNYEKKRLEHELQSLERRIVRLGAKIVCNK